MGRLCNVIFKNKFMQSKEDQIWGLVPTTLSVKSIRQEMLRLMVILIQLLEFRDRSVNYWIINSSNLKDTDVAQIFKSVFSLPKMYLQRLGNGNWFMLVVKGCLHGVTDYLILLMVFSDL